jgi:hypothetical protein
MKAIHKNLGEVEVLGPDKNGLTTCRTKDGQEIQASTPYLKPIESDDIAGTNTGPAGGD